MSWRLVIRRVFDAGVGCIRGGMDERSIESGDREPRDEAGREDCGVLSADDIVEFDNCQSIARNGYSNIRTSLNMSGVEHGRVALM